MRDGDWPAGRDLLAEAIDDAAGAPQHIAEAYDDEARRRFRQRARQRLADHLGETLRCAHDVHWIDGLVSRHQHEFRHAGRSRRARDGKRPERVVADCLEAIIHFHHRHVLVRRRMKDHRGGEARDDFADARLILDVADEPHKLEAGERSLQILLDAVQRVLGHFEQHEARRIEARNLSTELGPDRPAGAGDHHRAVAEPVAQARSIEDDRIASEQVVELDLADAAELDSPADQVIVRRNRQRFDARLRADLSNAASDFVVGRRQRDDGLLHREAKRPVLHLGDASQDPDPVHHAAGLRRIII